MNRFRSSTEADVITLARALVEKIPLLATEASERLPLDVLLVWRQLQLFTSSADERERG